MEAWQGRLSLPHSLSFVVPQTGPEKELFEDLTLRGEGLKTLVDPERDVVFFLKKPVVISN